mgnify:CR=1 FL=1
MGMRVTDLSCKEVVCICDGARLGYVSDVGVEVPDGQVKAIVVPGKCRGGGNSSACWAGPRTMSSPGTPSAGWGTTLSWWTASHQSAAAPGQSPNGLDESGDWRVKSADVNTLQINLQSPLSTLQSFSKKFLIFGMS